MLIDKREIRIGWAVSGGVGVSLLYVVVLAPVLTPGVSAILAGVIDPLLSSLGEFPVDKFLIIVSVIVMGPPSLLYHMRRRWKLAVDRNLPELLRDVALSQATGMTFIRALEVSSKKDYGPLSFFLKRALAKISWGVPYEKALMDMADRIGTVLVRRAVLLIVETGRIGGNIMEIMESIARHIRSLEALERERLTGMRPNVYIIYLGFVVLMVTVVLVYTAFISELFSGELSGSLGAIVLRRGPFTQSEYLRIYLHTTAIVAFFGGLVAGQLGEGSIQGGLKHTVAMLVATLIIFVFFVV
ncbi:MAG: type II secretion system F family protein [Candidatus Bathyarchaeia archaeon]